MSSGAALGEVFMINFEESKSIYLYSEKIDMRYGLNKIRFLVSTNFSRTEISHSVFVFCARNNRTIKLYYEDDYGMWLLQNRLFEGTFKLPSEIVSGTKLDKAKLKMLCQGLSVIAEKRKFITKEEDYF